MNDDRLASFLSNQFPIGLGFCVSILALSSIRNCLVKAQCNDAQLHHRYKRKIEQ